LTLSWSPLQRIHIICSNCSDPDQMTPIWALWSESWLFENVNKICGISPKKIENILQINKLGCSKVQYWNDPLFYLGVNESIWNISYTWALVHCYYRYLQCWEISWFSLMAAVYTRQKLRRWSEHQPVMNTAWNMRLPQRSISVTRWNKTSRRVCHAIATIKSVLNVKTSHSIFIHTSWRVILRCDVVTA